MPIPLWKQEFILILLTFLRIADLDKAENGQHG